MKHVWPKLPLGNALHQRDCDVAVDAAESYQFAGVYCFGRGVFRGQEKLGNQFAYQRLTRLRSGDFVYPKLMAWEGAFGVVPANCDGCVVSPEFPVFELDRERINPEFLSFYFQIPRVWEEVSGGSTGTNVRRRRLHPDKFLKAEVPMPPLAEQRRVVARIEALAGQIYEVRTLRDQSDQGTLLLFETQKRRMFESVRHYGERPMENAFVRVPNGSRYDKATVQPSGAVPVLSQSEESFLGFHNDAPSVGTENLPLVTFANHTCAVRFIDFPFSTIQNVFLMKPSPDLDARYFYHFLHGRVPQEFYGGHWSEVSLLKIPVPPLLVQQRIVAELDALQAEVDALKRLQAETGAELDALLPSILGKAFKGGL